MRLLICLAVALGALQALAGPQDGEWPLHGRTPDEQRFSPLTAS